MEHSAQGTIIIFNTGTQRQRLKEVKFETFAFAHDPRYLKAVPTGKNGGSAFYEPEYITKNIISLQQQ